MNELSSQLAVAFDDPTQLVKAQSLADRLGVLIAKKFNDPHPMHLYLCADDDRLELRVVAKDDPLAGGHGVCIELQQIDTTSGPGRSLQSPLHKAVGIRKGDPARPHVLDTTAGLGGDAWLLASAGCEVTAIERHPVIHALLEDALRRAAATAPDVASRIELQFGDAMLRLQELSDAKKYGQTSDPCYDVVLIDPMFPVGRKALERKPMRVLRRLVGDDPDAEQLLERALTVARRRVTVKRPRKAPPLGEKPPTLCREGKGFRFDLYPTG